MSLSSSLTVKIVILEPKLKSPKSLHIIYLHSEANISYSTFLVLKISPRVWFLYVVIALKGMLTALSGGDLWWPVAVHSSLNFQHCATTLRCKHPTAAFNDQTVTRLCLYRSFVSKISCSDSCLASSHCCPLLTPCNSLQGDLRIDYNAPRT